jgi:hypothetical protein
MTTTNKNNHKKRQSKFYVCKVNNCPMERTDATSDDRMAHKSAVKKAFRDDLKFIGCEKVVNSAQQILFCEMVIQSDSTPDTSMFPVGFSLVNVVSKSEDKDR